MNENLLLALSFGLGILLGVFFFAGLWWTVQKGLQSKRPALLFLSSMILRTAITLLGFYLVAAGHWQRFLTCLIGFMVARFIVVRFTRSMQIKSSEPLEE